MTLRSTTRSDMKWVYFFLVSFFLGLFHLCFCPSVCSLYICVMLVQSTVLVSPRKIWKFCWWSWKIHQSKELYKAPCIVSEAEAYQQRLGRAFEITVSIVTKFGFLSASLYFSKRGAYWGRLCRDVVGRWLVVTRVHCGQTVHPRPIVTMEH